MDSPIHLIACDWLQFHADHTGLICGVTDKNTNFKLKDLQHGTRVFKSVIQVYERARCTTSHRDELFATIALHPASSIMRPNMCLIKLENKVLYQQHVWARLRDMLDQLQLIYCGVTRADICVDLHEFCGGLHPLALLRGYRKNNYIKRGSRRYSQWMTAPYTPSKIDGVFTQDIKSEEHVPHCVSWGGPQSDVHVKMYNKTKEIKEESDKQYISAWHRRNGLDKSRDVWRVEISIQRRSRSLMSVQDGVVLPVDLQMLLDKSFLREVFLAMAHRHFSFKIAEVGKSARSFDELCLFNLEDKRVYVPTAPQSTPIAGRTCKVAANFLEKVCRTTDFDAYTKSVPYCREALETAHDILGKLYDGLKALPPAEVAANKKTRAEMQEQIEWLVSWNVLPDEIDGIKVYDLDYYYSHAERHQMYMEQLALRRLEIERYYEYLAEMGE